jgi:hypothetical protein
LAGLFNIMSLDMRENLNISRRAVQLTEEIAANTLESALNSQYLPYLATIDSTLAAIQTAQSTTRRDQGY